MGPPRLSSRLGLLAGATMAPIPPATRAARLSVAAQGPGSLRHDAAGRVLVEIRVTDAASARVGPLTRAGARVAHVSDRQRTVTALVSAADLVAVSQVAGVDYVDEVLTPVRHGLATAGATAGDPAAACAPIVSEGDTQLRAAEARSLHGVDGSGVTVGLLSDSYDVNPSDATSAADDVASGDIPGPGNPCGHASPVDVLDEISIPADGIDEGRGMAQIVHDLAPGSALQFASAFNGMTAFADNIRDLQAAGSGVIVDDVTYFVEPFFQDGPVSVAVNDVTAAGATYFSSAGNSNIIVGGNEVASYEAPAFRPSGTCPAGVPGYAVECHDFDPSPSVDTDYAIDVPAFGAVTLDLQWAEPWNGVLTDYDIYLLSPTNAILARSEGANVASQRPFEFLSFDNGATAQRLRIVVNRYSGQGGGGTAAPRLKFIHLGSDLTSAEYPVSNGGDLVGPTIFGHNGAANAGSTAAVPFNNGTVPEPYSSRGPVTLYFGPVSGPLPAAPLASPAVVTSPDFAATDGGRNTFFGGIGAGGFHRFYGTSAAAPHAAGVAALMLERAPSTAPTTVLGFLASTAQAVGGGTPLSVGGGLVDAVDAVGVLSPAAPPPPPHPDFDGDADTDRAVFRGGAWYAEDQAAAFLGSPGDIPVPGDYDGDAITDKAVYRDGAWFVDGAATAFLGLAGDVPVPGDYDGDGSTDRAVYRPSVGAWYVDGQDPVFFGLATDIAVPGDYDGDGTTDRAVWRPEVGGWYVEGEVPVFLGLAGDVPVPGDYDGDGSTDRGIWRPAVGGWYVDGQPTVFVGLAGDVPVPGDYDGDGTTDRGIWRPAVGGWYVDGQPTVFVGLAGDVPLPLPQAVYRRYF